MLALPWARPAVVTPGSASCLLWEMWQTHIRDPSTTAEGCKARPYARGNKVALGMRQRWCKAVMDLWLSAGWERGTTTLLCTHHALTHRLKALSLVLQTSLPGPVVSALSEMPSAARYAAVGMVGRPFPHVVRDVLCEGDEGIAEVREQHRYPPSAFAVRECGGNCRERSGSLTGDYAVRDLDNPRNLPSLCAV